MLLTAWFVESLPRKRGVVVWGHLATGALYGLVVLLVRSASSPEDARLAYLVGTSVFNAALGFLFPVWLSLFGEVIQEGSRGRVLGFTFIVNRLGAWAGGHTSHAVLAASWSPVDQWSLLFGVAMVAAVVGALPFLWVRETDRTRPQREPLPAYLRGLASSFRGLPGLSRFVVADILLLTGSVVTWHYGKVAMDRHGVERAWAGTWTSIAAVAQLVAATTIASLGSRLTPRRALVGGSLSMAAGAFVAVAARSAEAFALVAALCHAALTVRMVCHAPQVMRLSRGRDPTLPIGLAMSIAGLVTGLGPFVAGRVLPVLGPEAVFATVGGVCLLAAGLLARWVPDGGNPVAADAAPASR